MKQKTQLIQFDYYILIAYILLITIGLYFLLNISAVRSSMGFFYKQASWLIFSLPFIVLAYKINLDKFRKAIPYILGLTVLLLVLVLIIGKEVNGAKRFIAFSIPIINMPVNFQPSLLARVALILYFAHFLDKRQKFIPHSSPKNFLKYFNSLLVVPGIILALILAERHFSPLVISSVTLLSLLFLAKIRFNTILIFAITLAFIAIGIVSLGPKYRSVRMQIFQKYSLFLKNSNGSEVYSGDREYQIKQSLISLASGGFIGTGSQRGTGKHYFLPEAKTDYIFSIIGEEWGFIGALFVLSIFIFLFFRIMRCSYPHEDKFLQLAGMGLGMNIFYNAMVNIGVAISALPSTGVTLPFISYGGTSLFINSITIGLILNISTKTKRSKT